MRFLIAEDEPEIANSLRKNFADESIETDIAENGEVAVNLLKVNKYDALILDWRMPKMSGFEVCKLLRQEENNIPIILLTALSDISKKVDALNLGADDYVTKPFSFQELLARINSIMRRRTTSNQLSLGKMKLDLSERKLFVDKVEIRLTEKEFELLRYLIQNKGRILSKEELCEKVWQYNFVPGTNIVEAAIKNLRKKIEPYCDKNMLKNVYGEGYLLLEQ
jgi:DNA-binding response OmpR family regulator